MRLGILNAKNLESSYSFLFYQKKTENFYSKSKFTDKEKKE